MMKLACEQLERILRALQGPPVAHEKRRAERFPVSTPVEFARPAGVCHWTWSSGVTHDISELGLGLITASNAQRGDRIVVKLPDGAGGWMMVSCSVAHSRTVAEGLFALGLQYVDVLEGEDAPPPRPASKPVHSRQKIAPVSKV